MLVVYVGGTEGVDKLPARAQMECFHDEAPAYGWHRASTSGNEPVHLIVELLVAQWGDRADAKGGVQGHKKQGLGFFVHVIGQLQALTIRWRVGRLAGMLR
ncbi:hypothetical protein [Corynebacterium silvaticum]|uniref:Uncharacterized protein n=1 Tax=Corynebacterium silvaticum TaxID=2320431 RepID=A0ACD4PZ03_9CORY|nr:hypothetical protein [Corynebacterium silvaticum]MBH5300249.1 hypothetical protein [Corynebacterium silvaticum]UWH00770.1 hypothetical protein K1I39_03075 [Corynebacterium silvaticum]UWH02817.1 hypothetical protein K1I38_03085 [Corynebacterium silvaticum]UWH04857.1 hypothetical protein K1I36_03095 [Corynebacterium silvaticum]UXZ27016.1 hypothetical protein K3929_03085 [Corynebacterium silvaticum]